MHCSFAKVRIFSCFGHKNSKKNSFALVQFPETGQKARLVTLIRTLYSTRGAIQAETSNVGESRRMKFSFIQKISLQVGGHIESMGNFKNNYHRHWTKHIFDNQYSRHLINCKRVGYYITDCVRSKCFSSDSAGTTLFQTISTAHGRSQQKQRNRMSLIFVVFLFFSLLFIFLKPMRKLNDKYVLLKLRPQLPRDGRMIPQKPP